MSAAVAGFVTGLLVAVAITRLMIARRRRRLGATPVEVLAEERDVIEANFAAHIEHLRAELSEFADRLAGDDVTLRERLRVFEAGEWP